MLEPRELRAGRSHVFRITITSEKVRLVCDDHSCPFAHPVFVLFQLFLERTELVPGRGAGKAHDVDQLLRALQGPQKLVPEPDVI
jgi:hypothetical protein